MVDREGFLWSRQASLMSPGRGWHSSTQQTAGFLESKGEASWWVTQDYFCVWLSALESSDTSIQNKYWKYHMHVTEVLLSPLSLPKLFTHQNCCSLNYSCYYGTLLFSIRMPSFLLRFLCYILGYPCMYCCLYQLLSSLQKLLNLPCERLSPLFTQSSTLSTLTLAHVLPDFCNFFFLSFNIFSPQKTMALEDQRC